MPKRSAGYMAQRRRHILDALMACTRRRGWDRTTIEDVAAEAGLSKGAVYVHFENKQALLLGMLEREAAAIESLAAIDSLEAFRTSLSQNLELLAGPDGWILATGVKEAQIAGAHDDEIRPRLAVIADRMIAAYTAIVQRLRPDLGPADARRQGLGFIMLMDGLHASRSYCDSITAADMRAVIDQQVDALMRSAAKTLN